MPITESQVDISVDESINQKNDEEDYDPVIVTLLDPRSKAVKRDENNTNNEVDYQKKAEEIASLLDQPQMTTIG